MAKQDEHAWPRPVGCHVFFMTAFSNSEPWKNAKTCSLFPSSSFKDSTAFIRLNAIGLLIIGGGEQPATAMVEIRDMEASNCFVIASVGVDDVAMARKKSLHCTLQKVQLALSLSSARDISRLMERRTNSFACKQWLTMQNIVQYSTIHYNTLLYILLCITVLYCAVLSSTASRLQAGTRAADIA